MNKSDRNLTTVFLCVFAVFSVLLAMIVLCSSASAHAEDDTFYSYACGQYEFTADDVQPLASSMFDDFFTSGRPVSLTVNDLGIYNLTLENLWVDSAGCMHFSTADGRCESDFGLSGFYDQDNIRFNFSLYFGDKPVAVSRGLFNLLSSNNVLSLYSSCLFFEPLNLSFYVPEGYTWADLVEDGLFEDADLSEYAFNVFLAGEGGNYLLLYDDSTGRGFFVYENYYDAISSSPSFEYADDWAYSCIIIDGTSYPFYYSGSTWQDVIERDPYIFVPGGLNDIFRWGVSENNEVTVIKDSQVYIVDDVSLSDECVYRSYAATLKGSLPSLVVAPTISLVGSNLGINQNSSLSYKQYHVYCDGVLVSTIPSSNTYTSVFLPDLGITSTNSPLDFYVVGVKSDGTLSEASNHVSLDELPYYNLSGQWVANTTLTVWPAALSGQNVACAFTSGGVSYSDFHCAIYLSTGGNALYFGNTPVYSYGILDKDVGWINSSYRYVYFPSTARVSRDFYVWFMDNFTYLGSNEVTPSYTTTINVYDFSGSTLLKRMVFTGEAAAPAVGMKVSDLGATFYYDGTSYDWVSSGVVGFALAKNASSAKYAASGTYTLFGGEPADLTINLYALCDFTFTATVTDNSGALLGSYSFSSYPGVDVYWHISSSNIVLRFMKNGVLVEDYGISTPYSDITSVTVALDGNSSSFDFTGAGGSNDELQYFHLTSSLYRDYSVSFVVDGKAGDDGVYQSGVLGWFQRLFDGIISIPSKIAELIVPASIRNLLSSLDFSMITNSFSTIWDNVTSLFGLTDLFNDPAGPFGWLKE